MTTHHSKKSHNTTNELKAQHVDLLKERYIGLLTFEEVYRTCHDHVHHYPVRWRATKDAKLAYYIEQGPDAPSMFCTVPLLVRHYHTYQHLMPDGSIEAIPWWQMDYEEYHPKQDRIPEMGYFESPPKLPETAPHK